jgi:hypothetical protein
MVDKLSQHLCFWCSFENLLFLLRVSYLCEPLFADFVHRFLIEVDCSFVIKHNSKLNGLQTIQMSHVLLALLSSSEPSFEYSITGEQLLIFVLHDESTYTYLWLCLLKKGWVNLYDIFRRKLMWFCLNLHTLLLMLDKRSKNWECRKMNNKK